MREEEPDVADSPLGGGGLSAPAAFTRPPVATIPFSAGWASTLFSMADFISVCVNEAVWDLTSPAMPETTGVAMDVPLRNWYSLPL